MDIVRDNDVSDIETRDSQGDLDEPAKEGGFAQVIGSSGMILVASVCAMAVSMVTSLIIVRLLSVDDYGIYSYYFRIYSLLAFIAGFGLATKLVTDSATMSGPDSRPIINNKFYNLFFLRLLTVTVLVVAGGIIAWIGEEPLIFVAAVGASLLLLRMMFNAFLQGQHRVFAVAAIMLAQPFCFLILLLLFNATDALSIFLIFIVSIFFAIAIGAAFSIRYGLSWLQRGKLSLDYMKSSVEFGGQVAIISLLQMLYESGPILLLGSLGLFTVAATLSAPLNLVLVIPVVIMPLLTIVFYPRLRQKIAAGSMNVDGFISSYIGLIGAIALIPIVVMIAQPQMIVELLFTSKYSESAPVLVVLSFLAIFLLLERTLTWVLIGYSELTSAFRILSIRLVILAAGIAIFIMVRDDNLAILIGLCFVLSALAAVVLQLWRLRNRVNLRSVLIHLAALALVGLALTISISALLPDTLPPLVTLFLVTVVAIMPTAIYAWTVLLPAVRSANGLGINPQNDREQEFIQS